MEELTVKLAELLDITIESAIEIYPILRGQFVWYTVLDSVMFVPILAMILGIGLLIVGAMQWDIGYNGEEEKELYEKMMKAGIVILVFGIVLITAIVILSPVMAPDVTLIKGLLN